MSFRFFLNFYLIITLLGYILPWSSLFHTHVSLLILLLSVLLIYCYLHSLWYCLSITVILLNLFKVFLKHFIFSSKIMKIFFKNCSKITIKTWSLPLKLFQLDFLTQIQVVFIVFTRIWYTKKQQSCKCFGHQKYQNVGNKIHFMVMWSSKSKIKLSENFNADVSYIIDWWTKLTAFFNSLS